MSLVPEELLKDSSCGLGVAAAVLAHSSTWRAETLMRRVGETVELLAGTWQGDTIHHHRPDLADAWLSGAALTTSGSACQVLVERNSLCSTV